MYNMLYRILNSIEIDIKSRTETPEEFFAKCVSNRLQKGLEAYEDYIDRSVKYLSHIKEETLVRRI